jgi:hypothetical protein
VLSALVALLAACGGPSRGQPTPPYVRAVNAVGSDLNSVANYLYTPTDVSSAVAELGTVEAALRKAAQQLAAITPPRSVKADHERLIRAVDELANGVGPLIARLRAGGTADVGSAFVARGVRDARAAIAAINDAGYKIQIPLLS